jgi:hypothetical protein
MFFARRRRHQSLLHLVLLLLGIKCVCRRYPGAECNEESRAAHREKARLFRSKLKEAFSVWRQEEAPAAAPEAQTEHQG